MFAALVISGVCAMISELHCLAVDADAMAFFLEIWMGVSSLSGLIPLYAGVSPTICKTRKFSSLKYATDLLLPVLCFFHAVFFLRATKIKRQIWLIFTTSIFYTDAISPFTTTVLQGNGMVLQSYDKTTQAGTSDIISKTTHTPPWCISGNNISKKENCHSIIIKYYAYVVNHNELLFCMLQTPHVNAQNYSLGAEFYRDVECLKCVQRKRKLFAWKVHIWPQEDSNLFLFAYWN